MGVCRRAMVAEVHENVDAVRATQFIDVACVILFVAGTGLPPGVSMPSPTSPILDAYFRQMMGIPSTAIGETADSGCRSNEETFMGLCYMKCSLLTNGTFQLRTSAWTCCKAKVLDDCFVSNSGLGFGMCSGYDVSGDGKSCPRLPGHCSESEEMLLGQCYHKCSILTKGTHPYRTSPVSCCENKLGLSCFMPGKVVIGGELDTAGGAGDGDPSTPDSPYSPYFKSPSHVSTGGAPIAD